MEGGEEEEEEGRVQGCLGVYLPGVVANILVSVERPRMWNLVMSVFPSVCLSVRTEAGSIYRCHLGSDSFDRCNAMR